MKYKKLNWIIDLVKFSHEKLDFQVGLRNKIYPYTEYEKQVKDKNKVIKMLGKYKFKKLEDYSFNITCSII